MKKTLKRLTPDPQTLKEHKHLGWLGEHLHSVSLWNFNRKTISKAFAVGLFCTFLPVPLQMVLAAIGAVIFSANLPLSVALVWITNPLTIPPIFYLIYKLGTLLLGTADNTDFIMSWDYLLNSFWSIMPPLLLGSLIVSTISAIIGFWAVQLIYRTKILKRQKRQKF